MNEDWAKKAYPVWIDFSTKYKKRHAEDNVIDIEKVWRQRVSARTYLGRLFKEHGMGKYHTKPRWILGRLKTKMNALNFVRKHGYDVIGKIQNLQCPVSENYEKGLLNLYYLLNENCGGISTKAWLVLQGFDCRVFLAPDVHIKGQLEKLGVRDIEGLVNDEEKWVSFILEASEGFFRFRNNVLDDWNNYQLLDRILWTKDRVEKLASEISARVRDEFDEEQYPMFLRELWKQLG